MEIGYGNDHVESTLCIMYGNLLLPFQY